MLLKRKFFVRHIHYGNCLQGGHFILCVHISTDLHHVHLREAPPTNQLLLLEFNYLQDA